MACLGFLRLSKKFLGEGLGLDDFVVGKGNRHERYVKRRPIKQHVAHNGEDPAFRRQQQT